MKKLIAIITALFMLCTHISAGATTVSVAPALGIGGDRLTVAVRIDGNSVITAAALEIEYNSRKLSYLSYEKGEKLNAELCTVKETESGKLRFSFTDSERNYLGDGVLVYLNFSVNNDVTGTVEITPTVTEGALFDLHYIEMEYTTEAGDIYILPSSLKDELEVKGELIYMNRSFAAVELSQRLGRELNIKQSYGYVGSGCRISYNGNSFYTVYMGDVNGDAAVNTADYLKVRALLCGAASLSKPHRAASDINGDGTNSTADLLSLRNLLSAT